MHLPMTSPEVSTMHAASKPCSASRLLGRGLPCKTCGGEVLPDFFITEIESAESVDEGDNEGIPGIASA
tara:strand:- start:30 stop:236 length:207 start_codon:yes stop_codon:yes gene_type:complete